MRVLIMGGGVVGVTTAYQLLRDGHEVVLLERQDAVARETSWGNAGMIAPGHSFVWSSPRAPWILLKSLFRKDQALRFRFRPTSGGHLVAEVPGRVHCGQGTPQHTAQAPDRDVLATRAA